MSDKTTQGRFSMKRTYLEKRCLYGLTHFCDGTPNKSESATAKPKPRCPNYYHCELRNLSIFDSEVHYD
jgi:hypothetical protein